MSGLNSLILIAAAGGVAVSVQAHFMGLIDKRVGTLESMFITYGSGGLLIVIAMLLNRGNNLAAVQHIPWYAWTSGVLGLVIVGTIGYSTPRLGLVTALTIIVAAQFVTGAVIDHFGLFEADIRPMDLTRLLGVMFLMLGMWLIVR